MSKGFCYKTLETYDLPRDQLKSFCKHGSKPGYYNISNTRGICNDGQCRARENFQAKKSENQSGPCKDRENHCGQYPAAVHANSHLSREQQWDQVKGLYELNPQSNSCVSWRGNQEGNSSNDVKNFKGAIRTCSGPCGPGYPQGCGGDCICHHGRCQLSQGLEGLPTLSSGVCRTPFPTPPRCGDGVLCDGPGDCPEGCWCAPLIGAGPDGWPPPAVCTPCD